MNKFTWINQFSLGPDYIAWMHCSNATFLNKKKLLVVTIDFVSDQNHLLFSIKSIICQHIKGGKSKKKHWQNYFLHCLCIFSFLLFVTFFSLFHVVYFAIKQKENKRKWNLTAWKIICIGVFVFTDVRQKEDCICSGEEFRNFHSQHKRIWVAKCGFSFSFAITHNILYYKKGLKKEKLKTKKQIFVYHLCHAL